MQTNTVIGYRVKSGEQFVHGGHRHIEGRTWLGYAQPDPQSLSDAYRLVADFIHQHPEDVDRFGVPVVVPVSRPLTPIERASKELGGLLQDLCQRHGLNLGMTPEQMEKQIAKELALFGAHGISGIVR